MNSCHCVWSAWFALWVKTWVRVEQSSGRESSGTGCWCSWDVDPPCGYCRWRPAARLESSDLSSHTQTGTDTSCTWKGNVWYESVTQTCKSLLEIHTVFWLMMVEVHFALHLFLVLVKRSFTYPRLYPTGQLVCLISSHPFPQWDHQGWCMRCSQIWHSNLISLMHCLQVWD